MLLNTSLAFGVGVDLEMSTAVLNIYKSHCYKQDWSFLLAYTDTHRHTLVYIYIHIGVCCASYVWVTWQRLLQTVLCWMVSELHWFYCTFFQHKSKKRIFLLGLGSLSSENRHDVCGISGKLAQP